MHGMVEGMGSLPITTPHQKMFLCAFGFWDTFPFPPPFFPFFLSKLRLPKRRCAPVGVHNFASSALFFLPSQAIDFSVFLVLQSMHSTVSHIHSYILDWISSGRFLFFYMRLLNYWICKGSFNQFFFFKVGSSTEFCGNKDRLLSLLSF